MPDEQDVILFDLGPASGVDACLAALTGTEFSPQDPSPYPEPDIRARLDEVRAWNGFISR